MKVGCWKISNIKKRKGRCAIMFMHFCTSHFTLDHFNMKEHNITLFILTLLKNDVKIKKKFLICKNRNIDLFHFGMLFWAFAKYVTGRWALIYQYFGYAFSSLFHWRLSNPKSPKDINPFFLLFIKQFLIFAKDVGLRLDVFVL